ncbi:MAG: IclR family transcriptional regulator [Cytophagales bacterium]|nr:IclR family transcriptional regulator [Cytophagales bacterium]
MKLKKQKTEERQYSVPNLHRALDVIELLTQHPKGLSLAAIQEILEYPKSSLFRIISSLVERNYLNKNEVTGTFCLSKKLLHIGLATLSEQSLVEVSLDYMRALRDELKETVLLGTLDGQEIVLLEQTVGTNPFTFMLSLGKRMNLHASAPGKSVMAFLPDQEYNSIINRINFEVFNKNTISNKEDYADEIAKVKKLGYAFDQAEEYEGVHCVGAPIFNRNGYPIASVWVTAPSARLKKTNLDEVGKQVRHTALEISSQFGFVNSETKC